jgi:hypothetical protein
MDIVIKKDVDEEKATLENCNWPLKTEEKEKNSSLWGMT